jgi:transcriptional regulator with XRE-family HTH domain
MAELLEVSHSHYSKCESGHNSFSAKLLDKLCERTGVSRTWLTSGEGSMYSHSPKADSGLGQAIAGLHGDGRASSAQLSEGLVKRVLACAKDSRVVAAAEALSDATETTYDDALALVVVRRLAAEQ